MSHACIILRIAMYKGILAGGVIRAGTLGTTYSHGFRPETGFEVVLSPPHSEGTAWSLRSEGTGCV